MDDDQSARGVARGRVLGCPRWAGGEPHAGHAWEDPDRSAYALLWCEGAPRGGLLNDLVTARDLIARTPHYKPRTIFTAPVFKEPLVSTTLPPFSGDDPTCVKCGHVGATTRFLAFGACQHGTGLIVGSNANERLHRECHRCDYAWDEATVTTPTTKEPTP